MVETLIEPQSEISDLVKLIKHELKGQLYPQFSFDRSQDIPELAVSIDNKGSGHCIRYTSLSKGQRDEFIAEMSGLNHYGRGAPFI